MKKAKKHVIVLKKGSVKLRFSKFGKDGCCQYGKGS